MSNSVGPYSVNPDHPAAAVTRQQMSRRQQSPYQQMYGQQPAPSNPSPLAITAASVATAVSTSGISAYHQVPLPQPAYFQSDYASVPAAVLDQGAASMMVETHLMIEGMNYLIKSNRGLTHYEQVALAGMSYNDVVSGMYPSEYPNLRKAILRIEPAPALSVPQSATPHVAQQPSSSAVAVSDTASITPAATPQISCESLYRMTDLTQMLRTEDGVLYPVTFEEGAKKYGLGIMAAALRADLESVPLVNRQDRLQRTWSGDVINLTKNPIKADGYSAKPLSPPRPESSMSIEDITFTWRGVPIKDPDDAWKWAETVTEALFSQRKYIGIGQVERRFCNIPLLEQGAYLTNGRPFLFARVLPDPFRHTIATQAPLFFKKGDPIHPLGLDQRPAFWEMIVGPVAQDGPPLERALIVDVSGKDIWHYVPEDVGQSINFGEDPVTTVTLLSKWEDENKISNSVLKVEWGPPENLRTLNVILLKTLSWGDFSAPPQGLLANLIEKIQAILPPRKDKQNKHRLVVHCRAGVGRTGTLVTTLQTGEIMQFSAQRTENEILRLFTDQMFSLRWLGGGPAFVQRYPQYIAGLNEVNAMEARFQQNAAAKSLAMPTASAAPQYAGYSYPTAMSTASAAPQYTGPSYPPAMSTANASSQYAVPSDLPAMPPASVPSQYTGAPSPGHFYRSVKGSQ